MSSAAPTDLVIAFRSMQRRLRDAQGNTPPELTAGAHGEVATLLGEAAELMHSAAEPAAIADAIERLPANQWDPSVLARLGAIALELGRLVRQIASFNETD
jgi:hypothetical protein